MKFLYHHNPECTCEHRHNEKVPCTCGAEKAKEEEKK